MTPTDMVSSTKAGHERRRSAHEYPSHRCGKTSGRGVEGRIGRARTGDMPACRSRARRPPTPSRRPAPSGAHATACGTCGLRCRSGGKPEPPDQIGESRIGTKRIESRLHVQCHQRKTGAPLERFFQPGERQILFPQTHVYQGDFIGRRACRRLQFCEYLPRLVGSPASCEEVPMSIDPKPPPESCFAVSNSAMASACRPICS